MEYKTFKEYDIQIGSLLDDIKNGKIGLPDLQRPFVWKDAKVRDLLDSMMKGYPIGYIMTWGAPKDYGKTRSIGDNDKRFDEPKDLIIDGQQRLTSLIAALYGISVVDARGSKRHITISYNPLTAKFEVRDAATIKSNQYINEIKDVFTADYEHTIPQLRRALIDRLNSRRERFGQQRLSESEEDLIERNINRLLDIKKYTIHVIELTSDANEEDVAEIFSRGTDPKRKLMKKVCEVYPDVRIKWLEDGELPMLKSQDMSLDISMVVESIERLRGIITKQQETIERLCVLIEKKQ